MVEQQSRRDMILASASDRALDLVVYDRKGDEDLPLGAIEAAIAAGEITAAEIVAAFAEQLRANLPPTSPRADLVERAAEATVDAMERWGVPATALKSPNPAHQAALLRAVVARVQTHLRGLPDDRQRLEAISVVCRFCGGLAEQLEVDVTKLGDTHRTTRCMACGAERTGARL